MKKLANLYTTERSVYQKGMWLHVQDEDNRLFAEGRRRCRLHEGDLPKWYISGIYNQLHGFLSANGVKDMIYVPTRAYIPTYKDEYLLLSYDMPIIPSSDKFGWYTGFDVMITDSATIDAFLEAARQYSAYDTSCLEHDISYRRQWVASHCRERTATDALLCGGSEQ